MLWKDSINKSQHKVAVGLGVGERTRKRGKCQNLGLSFTCFVGVLKFLFHFKERS